MAKVIIEIDTENAAFCDGYEGHEITRIVQDSIGARTLDDLDGRPLMDLNGNRVGVVTVKD